MLKKFLWAWLFVVMLSLPSYSATLSVTNGSSGGSGSFVYAVLTLNQLGGEGHIINVEPAVKTITLTSELTISAGMTINGNGVTIEGNNSRRLIRITSGNTTFNRITFTKGNASSGNGGAVEVAGGASAAFNNCTFFENYAKDFGGAVSVTEGGLMPQTTFNHCTIAGNISGSGGGLAVINGDVMLLSSIILGNTLGGTVSYDIYTSSTGLLRGRYNVTGKSNYDFDTTNLTNQNVHDILIVGSNDTPVLETVNDVQVLRLTGTSPARDFVPVNSGSTISIDEAGTSRPQLNAYDAGAFEALPIPVQSVDISGVPYIQINQSEQYSVTITPSDASLNVSEYPNGIQWTSSNTSVISIDNNGKAAAVGLGDSYITANVHGWDSQGVAKSTASRALRVYVGSEVRQPKKATISEIPNVSIDTGTYKIVSVEVKIDINGIELQDIKGGRDYELTASPARYDLIATEIVSGDKIRLLAGDEEGSCDIRVVARPLPAEEGGESFATTFNVTVKQGAGANAGHSSGGGGCNISLAGIISMLVLGLKLRKE